MSAGREMLMQKRDWKFLCEAPPGTGPWMLKNFHGRVYAVSPNTGLFWLEITADRLEPRGWKANWCKIDPDGYSHTFDAAAIDGKA